jgi:branched-chain amino acid transport system ATP-binding protein
VASTLQDAGNEDRQADYLPESFGPPVAAGPEIDSLDARSSRLEGGRFRRLVPTLRLIETGVAPLTDAVDVDRHMGPQASTEAETTEAAATATATVGRSRWRRALSWADTLNPRTIPGVKMPLLVFGLTTLLSQWDDAAVGLIAPELRSEFGFSVQTLTNLNSIMGAITILAGLPLGYLVDRCKRVTFVRIGMILTNAGTLLQAVAPSQGLFLLGQTTTRSAAEINRPAMFPLMADYYPSRVRARVSAFIFMLGNIGRIVGLPLAGFLVVHFGWRVAVLSLGIIAFATSLLTLLLKEPVRGGMDRLEMGASRDRAAVEQKPPSWQEGLRAAWAVKTVRRNAYLGIINQFAGTTGLLLSLVQAEKFFLDAQQRAWLSTGTALLTLPALAIGGAVSDRLLSFRPSALVALQSIIFVVVGITTVINGLAPNLILYIAMTVLLGALTAAIGPASGVIMSLATPARVRGIGMQINVPFQLVGLALGPILVRFAAGLPVQQALLLFAPFYFIAALVILSTATTIEGDIRAARAASLADDEVRRAREAGAAKMLVVRDLDVSYDGVQILTHVDLDVDEGECLALLGTNGAGKSTLLRAIAGVHEADNGAVFFDGKDITHVPAHENARGGIVMMPGGQAVFPTMTVRENLTTAAWMWRGEATAGQAQEGIERVLGYFPVLRERLDLAAGSMSGGEQQMLALGQAFLMRPRLLMIDELSLGLAPAIIEQLLGIIRQLRDQGTTVLLVEQSLNVALTIAERAVFMEKGAIQFDGPTSELLRRPDLIRSIFMGGAVGGAAPRSRRRRASTVEGESGPVLTAEGIDVSFGGVHALSGVDVDVRPGEIVGIIGPNGAGKTTLFDVLSGHLTPDAGRVVVDGDDISALSPDARARLGLGRAFQNAKLFGPLTVRETIAVALDRRAVKNPVLGAVWAPPARRSERRIAARVDAYIEILGLEAHADKFVRELSTGTRRAVEVACQLAAEPKVLLLDEPSSGLAQAETEALGPALSRVVRETGCGLLIIEHDIPLVTSLSDRLVAMELGGVVVTGAPEDVVEHPLVLQSYLAASDEVIQRSGTNRKRGRTGDGGRG